VARQQEVQLAPPPSLEDRLERAKVAGTRAAPGRAELRHAVERIAANDDSTTLMEAWSAVTAIFGATPETPTIDAGRTIALAHHAAARVRQVATGGGRIAFASAVPASLLGVHGALVGVARESGATIADMGDVGPIRADGRHPRWLRWVDGVTVVTDTRSLFETRDRAAAREWMFVVPRPQLVVADGPFAEAAWEAGVEVVVFAGPDHCPLVVAAAQGRRCSLVPMRVDRAPAAYQPVIEAFAESLS
jgi:hypothetical protein